MTRSLRSLKSFLPVPPQEEKPEVPQNHVENVVLSLIDKILDGCDVRLLTREERLNKIRFMERRGIFQVKGSIEQVAARLGITKVTVYSYLDAIRKA